MEDLSDGTYWLESELTHIKAGWEQLVVPNPRRVGLMVAAPAGFWLWVKQPIANVAMGWQSVAGSTIVLNSKWHGTIVAGEWWMFANSISQVIMLETMLSTGSVYEDTQTAMKPGRCYKKVGERWEELVNGAFPVPSND